MKTSLRALILVGILSFSAASAASPLDEPDKVKHLGASFMISSIIYAGAESRGLSKLNASLFAVAGTMMIGLTKELSDDYVDREDLGADALGAVIAPLIWTNF